MLNRRFSAARLIAHMRRDKKIRDGALHFVLPRASGDAFTTADVPNPKSKPSSGPSAPSLSATVSG